MKYGKVLTDIKEHQKKSQNFKFVAKKTCFVLLVKEIDLTIMTLKKI